MSAPGGEGAKSGLSITEVAGNTVKFKLQKRKSLCIHFQPLGGQKRGRRGDQRC